MTDNGSTVWNFYNLIIQTLRDIKDESRVSKFALLTHLKALNFDFMKFYTFKG